MTGGWSNSWIGRWMRQKVYDPIVDIVQRGAEPKTLAMSGALGLTLGVFPIYGVTALLCAIAVAALGARCNAPTMFVANLVATPVELALVVPFLRLGEFLTRGEHFALTKDSLWQVVTGKASWEVVYGILHALLGWLVAAPAIMGVLYIILLPVTKFLIRRYQSLQQSREEEHDHDEPLMKDSEEFAAV